ncbi:hypothetical protein D3C76_818720 [compost metagenome]
MSGAQVRAEKTLNVGEHLFQVAAATQFAEVDAQVAERSEYCGADAQHQQQVDQATHASLQRSRRLS